MITCKSVRDGKERVLQFRSVAEASSHFRMFSKATAIGGHVKVRVFSISRTGVTIQENSVLGEEHTTYSGDEKEMTIIVVLAAQLLCVEKVEEAAIMADEIIANN